MWRSRYNLHCANTIIDGVVRNRRAVGCATRRAWELLKPAGLNTDYRRSLLEGLELFKGVAPSDIRELLQRCNRHDLKAGDLLLSPGVSNEKIFVILSGSLNVHVGAIDAPVTSHHGNGGMRRRDVNY